jgi:hypothetical protein
MTQAEWLASTDPMGMFKAARVRMEHRRLRLFAVACCRRIEHLLGDERSRTAIEVAERYADGAATFADLRIAHDKACAAHTEVFRSRGKRASRAEWAAVEVAASWAIRAAKNVSWMSAAPRKEPEINGAAYSFQADVVREIFHNPFPACGIDPACRTPAILSFAQSIYKSRSFDLLPERAAALEDAGCTDAELLGHLRSEGPHVRGCWALDVVLGLE